MGHWRRRSCTDVICISLFLWFLGGWGVVKPEKEPKINAVIVKTDSCAAALAEITKDKEVLVLTEDNFQEAIKLTVFLNLREFGERVFSDLRDTWWMIGIALIGACFLSFIWIILMRFMTGFMVWGSILIVFLGTGGALGYCSYRLYFAYMDQDPIAQTSLVEVGGHTKAVDIQHN